MFSARYRSLGAQPPGSDLRRAAGRGMEGYFWRFSDPVGGRVIVALCGVCRDRAGRTWANVALAAAPGGLLVAADLPAGLAAADRFEVRAGSDRAGADSLRADAGGLRVDLGPGTRLDVHLGARRDWATPWLGGVGVGQIVPGLGQYWHPHLFGATVGGEAELAGERVDLSGWTAYAEHTWGPGGFPARWWWGQAQGFPDAEVCVAFAGGEVTLGPARGTATGVVVATRKEIIRLGNPLLAPVRVAVDAGAGTWELHSRGPRWSLEILGRAGPEPAHVLPVPLPLERRSVPAAHEHLIASMTLTLRRRGRTVFSGTSTLAGLEAGETAPPQ